MLVSESAGKAEIRESRFTWPAAVLRPPFMASALYTRVQVVVVGVRYAVSGAERCPSISEDVPCESDIRSEIVEILLVQRLAGGRSGKVERRVAEQRHGRVVVYQCGLNEQRVLLVNRAEVLPAETQSQASAGAPLSTYR